MLAPLKGFMSATLGLHHNPEAEDAVGKVSSHHGIAQDGTAIGDFLQRKVDAAHSVEKSGGLIGDQVLVCDSIELAMGRQQILGDIFGGDQWFADPTPVNSQIQVKPEILIGCIVDH